MDHRAPLPLLLLVAALIAAGLGLLAWLGGEASPPPAAEPAAQALEPVPERENELPAPSVAAAPVAAGAAREALEIPPVELEEPLDPEADEDFEEITEEPESLSVPDDPPERGECTLQLYVVDRETGERVAGTVELWRLDAPANEHWSRGDQRQVSLRVEPEGRVVASLPAGVYRPYVQSAAAGSEHAQAFAVQGRWTVHEVGITRALRVNASLVLIDEQEQRLETAEIQVGRSSSSGIPTPPPWRVARTLLADGHHLGLGGGFGGSSGRREWRALTAGVDGFRLTKLRTDTRAKRHEQSVGVRTEGGLRLGLTCSVTEAVRGPVTFVAPYPTRERLLDGVVLPEGTPLGEVERVSVTVRGAAALLVPGTDPAAVARAVPYDVSVALAGYEVLEFEWRRSDEGPVNREMIPASR